MDVRGTIERLKNEETYRGQIEHLEVIPPREPAFEPLSRVAAPAAGSPGSPGGDRPLPPPGPGAGSHRGWAPRHRGIGHGQRQEPLLSSAGDGRRTAAARRSRPLPLSHQGTGPGPAALPLPAFGLEGLSPAPTDGDTPPDTRGWIRRHSQVVLSNPDMRSHLGILPNHQPVVRVPGSPAHVVVDEAHVTRGPSRPHTRPWCSGACAASAPTTAPTRSFILTTATLVGGPEERARPHRARYCRWRR